MRSSEKKKAKLTPGPYLEELGQDRENERRTKLRASDGIPFRMLYFELSVRDLGECRL